MQTYSIKWNYSGNEAGVFLYKSSSRTKYNWHCTTGFLSNSVPLNVYFILHYHLFFRKKYFFECLYFSEYDIRMFLFVYWWRTSLSIKYVPNRGSRRGDTENVSRYVKGKGFEKSVIRYVRTKWMPLNICCRIFFVRWLVMH